MTKFDMYKIKKKRAVDPNAPPRPNLLSHEKTIKETRAVIDQQQQIIQQLRQRIDQLETKMGNQTAYLTNLHQLLNKLRG